MITPECVLAVTCTAHAGLLMRYGREGDVFPETHLDSNANHQGDWHERDH